MHLCLKDSFDNARKRHPEVSSREMTVTFLEREIRAELSGNSGLAKSSVSVKVCVSTSSVEERSMREVGHLMLAPTKRVW